MNTAYFYCVYNKIQQITKEKNPNTSACYGKVQYLFFFNIFSNGIGTDRDKLSPSPIAKHELKQHLNPYKHL